MPTINHNDPENCPHCNVSLLDSPIPTESLEYYSGTHFKREIGVEIPEKYDGVWYYFCPDCKGEFGGRRAILEQLRD